jgi:PAS domain S-box-containing protein
MVSPADGLVLAGGLAGGGVCWSGFRAYRMPARLGRRSFVAFTLILGVGCLLTATVALVPSVVIPASVNLLPEEAVWSQIPLLVWIPSTFPWFVFALQYTGTRTEMSRRTVALLGAPYALLFLQFGLVTFDINLAILNVLSTAVFVYVIALAVGGMYLLLQATYSAGHLSLGQGISLSVVPIGLLVVWNLLGGAIESTPQFRAGVFATGAGLAAVSLGTALLRYDLFESTPSIDTLGERALTRETDDLMFVVDDDDRIIKINRTAVDTLGIPQSDALGERLADVIDHDTGALREVETVPMRTAGGSRQYDPQVSTVRDHHDNDLGATLSLRDVTERELREQRLAVLNRVLRHNLRNQADVVKANAESLRDSGGQVDDIVEAADAIAALGRTARRIDQYVSDSPNTTVEIPELVERVLEALETEVGVSVSVEVPDSARIVTNERALESALESPLENALTYADSAASITVTERSGTYLFRVVDDGPGVPEWELDSLDAATETALEHTTGIGLWQLKWAVMTLNGDLSFDTDGGTTVEIVVPDRGSGAQTGS